MAVRESTASCRSFGSLTPALVAKLAEQAFSVAAYNVLSYPGEDGVEGPGEFAESVSQAFEALLACHCQREGCGFLAEGYGQWVEDRLAQIPKGFRPMYHGRSYVAR